jgi:hypothetical protein
MARARQTIAAQIHTPCPAESQSAHRRWDYGVPGLAGIGAPLAITLAPTREDFTKGITLVIIATLAPLGIVMAALFAAGCGDCGGVPTGVVATVGDTRITMSQFQKLLTQATAQIRSPSLVKGSAAYDRYVATIVDYLVQEQVVAQSASALGVLVSDKELAEQVVQIEKASGGAKQVLALLKQQGMTMARLRREIKDQTRDERVSSKVVAKATVSEAQIRVYWRAHLATLREAKNTASFAEARAIIRQTLLTQARRRLWTAWLSQRTSELGVKYAAGYDPAMLTASPTPSAAASSRG